MSRPVELVDTLEERFFVNRHMAWNERLKLYVMEKENLPHGLTHTEYEREVQRLARKYRI